MTSINVFQYDPSNILANLIIGDDGSLLGGSLDVEKITVSGDINVGGLVSASVFTLDASTLNLVGALASIRADSNNQVSVADALNAINNQVTMNDANDASQSAQLAEAKILGEQAVSHAQTLDEKVASTSGKLTSLSDQITQLLDSLGGNDESTPSAEPELTPVETMFATDSAILASLEVTSEATVSGQLLAYGATIQDTFKSLGQTFLGSTNVAGDLSVDGTFSISEGSKINALPILYFQSGPLAQAVDFFNGLVTISKDGTVIAEKVIAKEVVSDRLTLSDQSAGEAVIEAGQTEAAILNPNITANSLIIITPETITDYPIAVSEKVDGAGFIAEISQPTLDDIKFNYIIIEKKVSSN